MLQCFHLAAQLANETTGFGFILVSIQSYSGAAEE